eukprot:6189260-Pleurochrysis_carterae.AAC.3
MEVVGDGIKAAPSPRPCAGARPSVSHGLTIRFKIVSLDPNCGSNARTRAKMAEGGPQSTKFSKFISSQAPVTGCLQTECAAENGVHMKEKARDRTASTDAHM